MPDPMSRDPEALDAMADIIHEAQFGERIRREHPMTVLHGEGRVDCDCYDAARALHAAGYRVVAAGERRAGCHCSDVSLTAGHDWRCPYRAAPTDPTEEERQHDPE